MCEFITKNKQKNVLNSMVKIYVLRLLHFYTATVRIYKFGSPDFQNGRQVFTLVNISGIWFYLLN